MLYLQWRTKVNGEPNYILNKLEKHHQLAQLNKICQLWRIQVSNLGNWPQWNAVCSVTIGTQTQFKTNLVNFLNAGENDSLPGFVNVKDVHLLSNEKSRRIFLPPWVQSTQKISMPLSESLPPRTCYSVNVSDAREDLKKDRREQIQVKIWRGLIPDLGSFESLKAFTNMNDNGPFQTHALRAAIDCHWSNWARRKFVIQALVYALFLMSFNRRIRKTRFAVIVFAIFVIIEFFSFAYHEFRL